MNVEQPKVDKSVATASTKEQHDILAEIASLREANAKLLADAAVKASGRGFDPSDLAGRNILATLDGPILMLKIDLSRRMGQSKSGRSELVATTAGNKRIDTDKGPVFLGLNVYAR